MIVHLSRGQNWSDKTTHPSLELRKNITDDENTELLKRYRATPTQELRDEIVFCNLHIVGNLVGRYMRYWPSTRRYENEMVAVGIETILERVDKMKNLKFFRPSLVIFMKGKIENFLNDNQNLVTASRSTNLRRVARGEEMVMMRDFPVHDNIPEK